MKHSSISKTFLCELTSLQPLFEVLRKFTIEYLRKWQLELIEKSGLFSTMIAQYLASEYF